MCVYVAKGVLSKSYGQTLKKRKEKVNPDWEAIKTNLVQE